MIVRSVQKVIKNYKPEELKELFLESKKIIGTKVDDQFGEYLGKVKKANVKVESDKASLIIYFEVNETDMMKAVLKNPVDSIN